MFRFLLLLHHVGLALGLGGLLCQLILLARFRRASDITDRAGSERMAGSVISLIQAPGVYLLLASGAGLSWLTGWAPLHQGWLHFNLLFFSWIFLATRLMARNAKNIHTLRQQCGAEDSQRLRSLKDNHSVIGYVTVLSFLLVLIF